MKSQFGERFDEMFEKSLIEWFVWRFGESSGEMSANMFQECLGERFTERSGKRICERLG